MGVEGVGDGLWVKCVSSSRTDPLSHSYSNEQRVELFYSKLRRSTNFESEVGPPAGMSLVEGDKDSVFLRSS